MILLKLFWEYFKTGLFAVGGGMATLPFLQRMGVATGWFTQAQLADMIAVSESTPGPIGVNMATYVGYTVGLTQLGGVPGGILAAVVATLGLVTPSITVILIVARLLDRFRNNRYVEAAFYGLRPASSGLIGAALVSLLGLTFLKTDLYALTGKLTDLFSLRALLLAAVLIYLTRFCKKTKKLHPIVFILASAVVGVVFRFAGA